MLNGGVMHVPLRLTKDGFEETIGVNHVGHFYLTNLLLDVVIKSKPSTIVVVSSSANFGSDNNIIDIDEKKNPEIFNSILQYSRSKLLNVVFSNELSRRLSSKEVYVNSLNPGGVYTNLAQHWNFPGSNQLKKILRLIMWESDVACLTQVGLAVSPSVFQQHITGQFFVPIFRKHHPNNYALNETLAKLSWESTENAIKSRGFSW